jgi:hypothetical protein
MLPDDVLLEIFDFYKEDPASQIPLVSIGPGTWRWKTLIQVCRRWRCVIFGSPRRLDLRVICTDTTPTRTSLDIWPPFAISILCRHRVDEKNVENVIAAIESCDRIYHIFIDDINGAALEILAAAMQQPLPILQGFGLKSNDESVPVPVLSETFLGGYAPSLEFIGLYGIPFPTLPKLMLSGAQIVGLVLFDIPNSGYISPDVMATCLGELPNLNYLFIRFQSPIFHPFQTATSCARAVLSALTDFAFYGISEYFEALVAQIDTPLLNDLTVSFFVEPTFYIPQLRHFIGRAERLKPFNPARMECSDGAIGITCGFPRRFELRIRCERPDWKLSSMTQILGQQLPLLSHVEELEIFQSPHANIEWMDNPDMNPSLWLDLFHLFITLQSLYVSEKLVPTVAAALQELTGGRTMEVLPALHGLFLEGIQPCGHKEEGIKSFINSRELSGHPVTLQSWKRHLSADLEPETASLG